MKTKNMTELSLKLAKLEGGKKSLSIAQIKEVLAHLSDLVAKEPELAKLLFRNGTRRARRKKK